MVQWKFDSDINGGFLAILELQSGFLKIYWITVEVILVSGGDKECGEYKNEN